jgi:hypothetical protein
MDDKELFKREFTQLYNVPDIISNTPIDDDILRSRKLFLRSYQSFIKTHTNPNREPSRLILKMGTGSGKTIASIACAMEFIKFYKENNIDAKVFILGFQQDVFINELLSRTEYGYITRGELEKYTMLKSQTSEFHNNQRKQMEIMLKKRLCNNKYGGNFVFIGYKEFFLSLFFIPPMIWKKNNKVSGDNNEMIFLDENIILDGIKSGDIKVNEELVLSFCQSLLICDEFHRVYNSVNINSYGFAIKFMLNIFDDLNNSGIPFSESTWEKIRKSKVSALFLTATIASNKATEVIDNLNIVIPITEPRLKKEDFFTKEGYFKNTNTKMLAGLSNKYISFLINIDPNNFPSKNMNGEVIQIPQKMINENSPLANQKHVPYLKFIRCMMTPKHEQAYKQYANPKLSVPTIILNDILIPIPAGYQISTTNISNILNNNKEFAEEQGLIVSTSPDIGSYLSGSFFKESNIKKYSSKYQMLLKHLNNVSGKIFIAHPYITYGVFIIKELLINNGYIEYGMPSASDTRCCLCDMLFSDHKAEHRFTPRTFINIHGGLHSSTIKTLKNIFNSPANKEGHVIQIIIGSKVIFEGVDFNCLRHIFIASFPSNIPTIIQILGRGIRDGSHKMLPIDQRTVNVYIFVSSISSGISYEESRYISKMDDYLVIQEIEKIINENAIDSIINNKYIKNVKDDLLMLPFDPSNSRYPKWTKIIQDKAKINDSEISDNTFNLFFSSDQFNTIIYIIKRLFVEVSPVFHIDDLWEQVKCPPFNININTLFMSRDNFLLAVDILTNNKIHYIENNEDNIFSRNKIIYANDKKFILCNISDHIMMFPYKELIKYNTIGTNISNISNNLLSSHIDFDSVYRSDTYITNKMVDITTTITNYNITYEEIKHKFYNQFRESDLLKVEYFSYLYNYDFHKQLISDTVLYVFHVMVNAEMSLSEMHEFYFKLLHLYYRLNLIIFASDLSTSNYYDIYRPYLSSDMDISAYEKKHGIDFSDLNPLLITTLTGITNSFNISRMDTILGTRTKSFMSQTSGLHFVNIKYQISDIIKINKVPANILPIGTFLTHEISNKKIMISRPKLYNPSNKKWFNAIIPPTIYDGEKENDVLVGYTDYDYISIETIFKIREPSEDVKDRRLISKGMNCLSKNKNKLLEYIERLGIKTDKTGVCDMCEIVKMELIKREINSIKNYKHTGEKVRWFYFHYEQKY